MARRLAARRFLEPTLDASHQAAHRAKATPIYWQMMQAIFGTNRV